MTSKILDDLMTMAENLGERNLQKSKFLIEFLYLWRTTDEDHPIPTNKFIHDLSLCGIHATRKTLYDDMQTLFKLGVDVVVVKRDHSNNYFIGKRFFELTELRVLCDIVRSSAFFSEKKTQILIDKMKMFQSVHEAKMLDKPGKIKTPKAKNNHIYYTLDTLLRAMLKGVKVTFNYVHKEPNGEKSDAYEVTPLTTMYDQEQLYLCAHDDGVIKTFRVDRMDKAELTEKKAAKVSFSEEEYRKQSFAMFDGKDAIVSLTADIALYEPMCERFPSAVRAKDGTVEVVNTKVFISDKFFGYVASYGGRVKITAPEDVKQKYRDFLARVTESAT